MPNLGPAQKSPLPRTTPRLLRCDFNGLVRVAIRWVPCLECFCLAFGVGGGDTMEPADDRLEGLLRNFSKMRATLTALSERLQRVKMEFEEAWTILEGVCSFTYAHTRTHEASTMCQHFLVSEFCALQLSSGSSHGRLGRWRAD